MPSVSLTYPGVYIEEIPSGSHSIVGVATSITAFVGRAPLGPVDEPTDCFSFGDFERYFGGLHYDYPLSYAVQDFFENGGGQAIICRLFEPPDDTESDEDCCAAVNAPGGAPLIAANPGKWGNGLQVAFDYVGLQVRKATAATAQLEVDVADPTQITGNETITVTLTQPAPTATDKNATSTVTVTANPARGEGADVIANELKNNFEHQRGTTYQSATVQPGATAKKAVVTFSTTQTGTAANAGSIDAALDPAPAAGATAPVSFAFPGTTQKNFGGALPSTKIAAQLDVVFGGAADANEEATFGFTFGNAPPFDLTIPKGTAPDAAAKLFKAAADENAGRVVSTAIDKTDAKIVHLLAGVAGAFGNNLTATVDAPKASAVTVALVQPPATPPATAPTTPPAAVPLDTSTSTKFVNGVDNGADTGLAQQAAAQYLQYGIAPTDLFNVSVQLVKNGRVVASERFTSVTVNGDKSPTRIDRVLKAQSALLAAKIDDPSNPPASWGPYAIDFYQGDKVVPPPAPGAAPANPPVAPTPIWYTAAGGVDSKTPLDDKAILGDEDTRTGMYALEHADLFNLLCIPPDVRNAGGGFGDVDDAVWPAAAEYCAKRRAMLIVDPPNIWASEAKLGRYTSIMPTDLDIAGDVARNAAVYFPRVVKPDLLMNGQTDTFVPCGLVAGVYASTDASRGVWKAPAGLDAGLNGVSKLDVNMTDDQNGILNPLGINAIRTFPVIGNVVWGARTLRGADVLSDDFKYIPVRRLTLYIEESLYRGTKWAVFEPNEETLWSQLRLTIGSFMAPLAQQGAFYNYFVQCDAKTTTPTDIANGVVNVIVAFAPVKPAEFVVLQITQLAGQTPA